MKESFNGPEFLGQKFQDIHVSEEAQTLAEYTTRKEDLPKKQSKHATIDRYLRGLDRIMKNRLSVAKLIEQSITDDYVFNVEDPELVKSLARDLYESEKKVAINQGRGGDIQQLDDEEILERYKESIIEKAKIQKESLQSWITYLKEGEDYPMWFKYYVVRSLKKMGQFNRDATSYGTRTERTIAPFPEMNAEALAFVFKGLTGELEKEELELNTERKEELEQELDKRLASKDFAKLYAFAQVECAGNLDRESLEGEWVVYPQGSDYRELEKGLKGKGTGWCTASGSAQGQLANGDFHVFYTKNKAGIPTEPRIAVRMENRDGIQTIAEVRGVDASQALEPALVNTAKEHYSQLNGAERYEKADRDMKMLTAIYDRCFKVNRETQTKVYLDPVLNESELRFLYEIDAPIKGFGYEKDPRISSILSARKFILNEDISTALNCPIRDVPLMFYAGDVMNAGLVSPKIVTGLFRVHDVQGSIQARDYTFPESVRGDFSTEFVSMDGAVLPRSVGDLTLNSLQSSKGILLPEVISLPEQSSGIKLSQEERTAHALLGADQLDEATKVLLYNGLFPGHRNGIKSNAANCFGKFPAGHSMKVIRVDGATPKPTDDRVICNAVEIEGETQETLSFPFWLLEVRNMGSGYDDLVFSQDEILEKMAYIGLSPLTYEDMVALLQNDSSVYEGAVFVIEHDDTERPLSYMKVVKGNAEKIEELGFEDLLVSGFKEESNVRNLKMNKVGPLTDNPFARFFDAEKK